MPFDIGTFSSSMQLYVAPYETAIVIGGSILVALWLVLMFRALQDHNQSEVAQLDRLLRQK